MINKSIETLLKSYKISFKKLDNNMIASDSLRTAK